MKQNLHNNCHRSKIRLRHSKNEPVKGLLLSLEWSRLIPTLSRLTPWCPRPLPMTPTTLTLPLPASMRMINRVHCHPPHHWPPPEPPALPRLPQFLRPMSWVRHRPYRGPTPGINQLLFPRRQPDQDVAVGFRLLEDLGGGSRSPDELPALPRVHLDVVDESTDSHHG